MSSLILEYYKLFFTITKIPNGEIKSQINKAAKAVIIL